MIKCKKLFLMIICLIMVMGVSGCITKEKNLPEKMKDMALEYLNENYDDTFTALGYSSSNWAYKYSSVRFTSKKYSQSVEVRIYEENGIYSFKDDYFQLYMEDDAIAYLKNIVSKYEKENEVKVRFISPELPDSLDTKAAFPDYLASHRCNLEVYIISGSTFNKSDMIAILSDICDAKIMGFFRFTVTNDKDLLSAYSISEIVNDKNDSIIEKKSFSINKNFEVDE